MEEALLNRTLALLIIAVLVALAARRLRLPYTVGLVAMGMALASSPAGQFELTPNFVFDFILPPLLFEATLNIHWRELKRDLAPILTLALAGTVLAAAVTAFGLRAALGWPARPAILFGILIAATDPVAVIAMFKDNRITGRLRLLTESESLFNDGVAAVLFTLALTWAELPEASLPSPAQLGLKLLITVGGGMAAGAACAGAALLIARRTGDHLVVVENTPERHNMVVCTLCSCYPWELLGLPPVWYKSSPYRSRAVKDPRGVLADFGVTLPKQIEIRVWDSTAETRFLVLPMRPKGTDGFSEEQLAELVTRDSMIGTGFPKTPGAPS
jgi:Kef-type K+ transport system membrane component KefB